MNYRNHLAIGYLMSCLVMIITNILFGWFSGIEVIFISLIIVGVFSLLPDIDHPNSKITWFFIGMGILAFILSISLNEQNLRYTSLIILIFVFLSAQVCKHRGFYHSISAALIMSFPLSFFHLDYGTIGFVAYYSHLIADGLWIKLK